MYEYKTVAQKMNNIKWESHFKYVIIQIMPK